MYSRQRTLQGNEVVFSVCKGDDDEYDDETVPSILFSILLKANFVTYST